MIRYSVIEKKNPREIVLLKSKPCFWGKCTFCDYIADNSADEDKAYLVNEAALKNVIGKYNALEVVNSGSVFELSQQTMALIKDTCRTANINKLYFEAHWAYHKRLDEIRQYFGLPIIFKCGIESFDNNFRNDVLNKGAYFDSPEEVALYMDSICLLVGVEGQTKEMIKKDIEILLKYFKYGCINIYVENSTPMKADADLISWFRENYGFLSEIENIDLLWNNTDLGIGG